MQWSVAVRREIFFLFTQLYKRLRTTGPYDFEEKKLIPSTLCNRIRAESSKNA